MLPVSYTRLLLVFAAVLPLSGCGFAPMYGDHAAPAGAANGASAATLSNIVISNIPDRSGVYLRNALIDRFYTNGYPVNPAFTLSVEPVKEVQRDLDLTKSSEATRNQLTLSTTLKLYDAEDPTKPVLVRPLSSINSYNVLESEFATRVTEDSARLSGLNDLARQIELNIVLYLNRSKPAPQVSP